MRTRGTVAEELKEVIPGKAEALESLHRGGMLDPPFMRFGKGGRAGHALDGIPTRLRSGGNEAARPAHKTRSL